MRQLVQTSPQIGALIRARRRARRMSQHALAAQVGISQSRLSILETDPSSLPLDRLIVLLNLLGLELVVQEKESAPSKARW